MIRSVTDASIRRTPEKRKAHVLIHTPHTPPVFVREFRAGKP